MEFEDGVLSLSIFSAITLGIIAVLLGKQLNEKIDFLRNFSIPEAVTGGLLFAAVTTITYSIFDITVEFDLSARDFLLVYFFTTIGINANVRDLVVGGKPLVILLVITIIYMFVQNLSGVAVALLFDRPAAVGIIGGTVSLIGGHGTAIAWAPELAENGGVPNAMEMGLACATFGLVLASLMGGPVAKYLIKKHDLQPETGQALDVGKPEEMSDEPASYMDFLDAILAINICIVLGKLLNSLLLGFGIALPLFVTCLAVGILITSFTPRKLPLLSRDTWPTRTPAMALIAEISLGAFLAMSLMSLQLWTLLDLALPIFTILTLQVIIAVSVIIFVVFRAMGSNYDAAVICAGFGGISLGSTPTAMANMAAISQRYGASHLAFLVVPLVCAFFIDIANAIMIPAFLYFT